MRQPQRQLRLQGALQMQVKFRLGQAANERFHRHIIRTVFAPAAGNRPSNRVQSKCVQWVVRMGQLSTHVLDISGGLPAAGVRIELLDLSGVTPRLLTATATARDGRCPAPLLTGADFRIGRYGLTFYLAEYFRGRGITLADPPFIEEAVVRIGIAHAEQHYHVPLLITPWSYSVYRGG